MKSKIIFLVLCAFITSAPILANTGGNKEVKKLIKQAKRERNLNHFKSAEDKYLEAISLDNKSFEAHFQLGLLYESAFYNKEKSHEEFKTAEQLMPEDTVYELYLQLGQSYHYFEAYATAINYYKIFEKGINKNENIIGGQTASRIKECEFAISYDTHLYDGKIKNLGEKVNSNFAEYVPVFIERDSALLFTRRGLENIGDYYWDNQYYEDMYISYYKNGELTQGVSFGKSTDYTGDVRNSKKHESVVEITSTEDTLLLYQENHLWYSIFENGKWQKPTEFSEAINLSKYQRHGCLSADGKTMYFSSDSEEGLGGYDIFKSEMGSNGEWSKAVPLSANINTTKDDDSPFLSEDGKALYFSSKGHEGMGGYDVFYSEFDGTSWSKAKNMGTPVNSPANDIYYRKVRNSNTIYLSSDRKGGFGNMDIYTFQPFGTPEFNNCIDFAVSYKVDLDASSSIDNNGIPLIYEWEMGDGSVVKGKKITYTYKRPGTYEIKLNAIDSLTGRKILNEDLISVVGDLPITLGENDVYVEASGPDTVKVNEQILFDTKYCQVPEGDITNKFWKINNTEIIEQDSILIAFEDLGIDTILLEIIGKDKDGNEFRYCVAKSIDVLSEDDYLAANNTNDTASNNNSSIDIGSNLNNENIIQLPDGTSYKLENIYFNFDRYYIRKDAKAILNSNIKTLKEHPEVVINVVGYTDAMGSNSYNIRLSKKRAKSAVAYLTSKGIDINRIKATLYKGENDPAAPNSNADGTDNPTGRQLNRRVEFYVIGTVNP